jgi:hypothetical protein
MFCGLTQLRLLIKKRTQRPQFNHVVLPRTSGMEIILDAVKDVKPDIYDLTIAFPSYSGEIPTFDMGYDRKTDIHVPSMKTLLAGKSPGQVAVHARKFSFSEAEKDLQGFLDTRWAEKDVRLDHFIKHQQFPVAKNEKQYEFTTPVRFYCGPFASLPEGSPVCRCSVELGPGGVSSVVWRHDLVLAAALCDAQFLPTYVSPVVASLGMWEWIF